MGIAVHTPPTSLAQAELPELPLVTVERAGDTHHAPGGQRLDTLSLRSRAAGFEGPGARYAAAYRADWTAQSFESALKQLNGAGLEGSGLLPLVVLPYLNEEKLAVLAGRQVSGLDLCGNALLIFPGRVLVQRSGQPNRFRVERRLQSPYTGRASLVGRALLAQPSFGTAGGLLAFIHGRGGELSQALVSRSLRALEDELIVSQSRGQGVRLIQPARLLDRLARGWQALAERPGPQEDRLLWRGRVELPPEDLLPTLAARAQAGGARLTATGLTSASRLTNLSSGDLTSVYIDDARNLLSGLEAQETRRFPNLELWRPPDEAVYFDTVQGQEGGVWASPLQAYLEMANGDARTQQAASSLRAAMLERAQDLATGEALGDGA